MKKRLSLLLAALLVLLLAACGPAGDARPAGTSAGPASPILELPVSTPEPTRESARAETAAPEQTAEETAEPSEEAGETLPEDGCYTSKEDVALYLHLYGRLPGNFMTKREALEPYAPGMCIGGGRFGNYEGLLPEAEGRTYTECDIDTLGASKRGAKRIVFSNDGLIYYTQDHYASFELLYGEAVE